MKRLKKIAILFLAVFLLLSGCGGGGRFRTIGKPLLSEEMSIGFRSGDKLRDYVTAALNVLAADGTLADLSRKWFGSNISLLKGDASALETFAAEGIPVKKLIVGVDAGAAPMCFKDAYGNFIGFDIELAVRIADKLGWTLDFHAIMESDLVAQLDSGNVDFVMGGMNTSVHGAKISSSPSYIASEKVLAVMSDSGIGSRKRLEGKVLAMTFDPVSESALSTLEGLRESLGSIKKLDTPEDCLKALESGGCDAVIVDSLALEYYRTGR